MVQGTAPIASLFIVLHHNVTVKADDDRSLTMYSAGRRDFFAVIFYTMISIVIHAVIQEYGLDKLNRKLHLSKVKHSKFNESGQLAVFFIVAAVWGANIMYGEKYVTGLSSLWEGYPHVALPYWVKFYFVLQICYWLHNYPELYFQKVKRDDMPPRITYTTIYLLSVTAAYALNLTRLGLSLLVLHYSVEFVHHIARLLYFAGRVKPARALFMLWNILFVLARIATVTLAFLTFQHGLEKSSRDSISFRDGNFNTKFIRINCLAFVSMLQAWLMWNFITFQLRRFREWSRCRAQARAELAGTPKRTFKWKEQKKAKREAAAASAEASGAGHEDFSDLPEADQNHLRHRKN